MLDLDSGVCMCVDWAKQNKKIGLIVNGSLDHGGGFNDEIGSCENGRNILFPIFLIEMSV